MKKDYEKTGKYLTDPNGQNKIQIVVSGVPDYGYWRDNQTKPNTHTIIFSAVLMSRQE
jgi:hypothetical protein